MTKVTNPIPIYLDARGNLIDGGKIYVGTANADPQVSPVTAYWDAALTIVAAQPLRTSGGYVVNNGQPANFYVSVNDYSMRLADNADAQIFYSPSTSATAAVSYQPLDDDLTAIASQANKPYGLGLLKLATQAALKAATGIPDPLPISGGTVTGDISRQGGGKYLNHGDSSLLGHSVTRGTAAPSGGNNGDIYFQYTA